MTDGLAGTVALVTGGGRGIGRAVCLDLAAQGVHVGVNYRVDAGAAAATVEAIERIGGKAVAVAGDVSVPDDVTRVVGEVVERLGPVDHLVNNAGFSRLTPPDSLGFDEWRMAMAVNLDGPFLCTWAVKDAMIARGGGAIVNIGSVAGLEPNPDQVHYGTAKAALHYLTRVCAHAFAATGIRVNAVAPGLTMTDRAATVGQEQLAATVARVPLRRAGQPAEVAAAVRFLLSDEAAYVTGQVLAVSGGRP